MKPMIVAELSCNHAGDKAKAHRLIDAAKEAGADAVKLQLYEPDEMTWPDGNVLAAGPWRGQTLSSLYRAAMTPRAWFPPLFEHARSLGLEPFASVFSLDGVEYMEDLGVERYKIASAEVVWPELLEAVAATGRPAIISDGIATPFEVAGAWDILGAETTVLRCVSGYPAKPEEYGLADPEWPSWGVSDHSVHPLIPTVATAMGASMIEAHLMLDRDQYDTPPLDHGHSYTPFEFGQMVTSVRLAHKIATQPKQVPDTIEEWRRRLVWGHDMGIGTEVGIGDIVALRGSRGILPYRKNEIVGKRLVRSVRGGEGVEAFHVRRQR